jgi:hypothetical protein
MAESKGEGVVSPESEMELQNENCKTKIAK